MTNNISRTISIPDGVYDTIKMLALEGNVSWSKAATMLLIRGIKDVHNDTMKNGKSKGDGKA